MDFEKMDKIFIRDLLVRTIIGIYDEERVNRQDVIINLTLYTDFSNAIDTEDINDAVNYHALHVAVMDMVESSSYPPGGKADTGRCESLSLHRGRSGCSG